MPKFYAIYYNRAEFNEFTGEETRRRPVLLSVCFNKFHMKLAAEGLWELLTPGDSMEWYGMRVIGITQLIKDMAYNIIQIHRNHMVFPSVLDSEELPF